GRCEPLSGELFQSNAFHGMRGGNAPLDTGRPAPAGRRTGRTPATISEAGSLVTAVLLATC
ncbi:MAG: hypothetical protein LC799_35315, partial [Actinobacteria bacterium]|nr:hypothetical protein [Actinomycetota bacterium]